MFRGRFLFAVIAFLLILGVFSLASSSIYRAGWTQGYLTAQVPNTSEAVEASESVPESAPVSPNRGAHFLGDGLRHSSLFGLVGGFFKFFVMIMLIGMAFKFFGFMMWRKRGRWGKHGGWHHGHHGHKPPWFDDSGEEPVMKA